MESINQSKLRLLIIPSRENDSHAVCWFSVTNYISMFYLATNCSNWANVTTERSHDGTLERQHTYVHDPLPASCNRNHVFLKQVTKKG